VKNNIFNKLEKDMKYLIIVIVISCVIACNSGQEQGRHSKVLTHRTIDLKDEIIGKGGFLIACKEGIAGLEESPSFPAFYYVNMSGGEYFLSRFVNRGQSSGDVLYPFNMQYLSEDTLGVYDIMNMSYYHVPVTEDSDSVNIRKCVRFEARYYRVIRTVHNQYIGLSMDEGLLVLSDADGNPAGRFFEYPYRDGDEKRTGNSIRALAYQGSLMASPDATKCVYAPFNGDIIHFYDIGNDGIRLIDKSEKIFPGYDIENNSARTKINTVRGYVSVATTDSFVYALFCGLPIETLAKEGKDPMEGQILRVFDWNGKTVKETGLDIPCKHIGISHDDKTLWAIASTPEIELVRFDLNEDAVQTPGNEVQITNRDSKDATPLPDSKPGDEDGANRPHVTGINLKDIYLSKTDTVFSVLNDSLTVKSIEKTSPDIAVNVIHRNNHTVIYYLTTKETSGRFSDTVTVNFESGETVRVNLYGNVINNPIFKIAF
jgi:hypothetical protein